MKFKKDVIKPGMVIHPTDKKEAKALLEYLDVLGYVWGEGGEKLTEGDSWIYKDDTCYEIEDDCSVLFSRVSMEKDVVEFSDLIEPDDGLRKYMDKAEILTWLKIHNGDGIMVALFGTEFIGHIFEDFEVDEILDKITAYEAAKKAPKPVEVEGGYWYKAYSTNHDWSCEGELWGYELALADEKARSVADEHVKRYGGECGIEMRYICRVKEDKA